MRKNLNNLWKFIAGGGTLLSYPAWYSSIQSAESAKNLNELVQNIPVQFFEINEKIDTCLDVANKAKLLKEKDNFQDKLENLYKIHKSFHEKGKILAENSEVSNSLFDEYNNEFTNAFKKAREAGESLENAVDSLSTKLSGDNSILEIIKNFQDYLSTLNFSEICLVMNICGILFILSCLVSILFAFYGKFLIEKLSLEERWPKLSGIIKLRIKFQHYYILINTLFLCICLGFMLYVNIMTLIYS